MEKSLGRYVRYLKNNCEKSQRLGGTYATSVLVNQEAWLESPQAYQLVAQELRALGYTVYAPPSRQQWEESLKEDQRNGTTVYKFADVDLNRVILVDLQEQAPVGTKEEKTD